MVVGEQAVEQVLPGGLRLPAKQHIPQGFQRISLGGKLVFPADFHVVKLEQRAQFAPLHGAVAAHFLLVAHPALAHGEQLRRLFPAEQRVDELMQPGAEAVAARLEVLGDLVDHVHPEAVHAHVHPEVHHILHGLDHGGIVPVQVGLAHSVGMQVILPPHFVERPGAAPEAALPVVGDLVKPVVEVAVRVVPALAGFLEPSVGSGGMVGHQVHDDFHVPGMHLGDKPLHVLHGAELVHDVPVVGDVIAVVVVGALVAGAEPDGVHAQLLQIVQLACDAGQVADAVAVGIHEAAGVDLVDHQAQAVLEFLIQHNPFLLVMS